MKLGALIFGFLLLSFVIAGCSNNIDNNVGTGVKDDTAGIQEDIASDMNTDPVDIGGLDETPSEPSPESDIAADMDVDTGFVEFGELI